MNEPTTPADGLDAALKAEGVELPAEQAATLERYCRALWDWNSKLNLTRHTTFQRFVARDLRDTLELSRLLAPGEDVLDVGAGGGVPGIPLAIIRSDLTVTLIDSVGKKVRALADMAQQLELPVTVVQARVQDYLAGASHDTLLVRAVARLDELLGWVQPHWGQFRRLLVVKGPAWTQERAAARERRLLDDLDLRRAARYPLAGTDSESVILEITRGG